MRVLLAGGGSGGSAAPVIAVAEALARQRPGAEFLYVGTRAGPEAALVAAAGLPYAWVASGRLRRYWTWRNLVDPVLAGVGVIQALRLVGHFRPEVAFGAGGFATVPPLLAARTLGVPLVIHQQDLLPGLANRVLAPFAARLTVAFPETVSLFRTPGARAVGNPVRGLFLKAEPGRGRGALGLEASVPVVLAVGGGTGALGLNRIVAEAAQDLVAECQVVHLTGVGKAVGAWEHPRYHPREFLTSEMADVLAAAAVVVTRAGMSALAETSALGKPAILVPMPASHQEANAAAFAAKGAAIVVREASLTPERLASQVHGLLADAAAREAMGKAAAKALPRDAAEQVAAEICALAGW